MQKIYDVKLYKTLERKLLRVKSSETVLDDIRSKIRAKYNYKIIVKG